MGILQGGKVLESKDRGFIVGHYTDYNGKKVTRDEIVDKIKKHLQQQDLTAGQLGGLIKLQPHAIHNVLYYMFQHDIVRRKQIKGQKNLYSLNAGEDCLLHSYFYPSVEEIEKSFKILGRKTYHAG